MTGARLQLATTVKWESGLGLGPEPVLQLWPTVNGRVRLGLNSVENDFAPRSKCNLEG